MEAHVQQRDARARAALTSGTRITVRPSLRPRATSTSRSLATRRFVPTSAGLRSTRLALARHAAAVDDRDRVAVDAVAGEPGDRGDGRVEVGEHLQRAVAEHVAAGAGVEHRLHQRPVEHALVAAADADRDRLRLVLDRVDRPGELLDRPRQRERRGRRSARPACRPCPSSAWYSSSGRSPRHVAQQPGEPHRRGRLEVAVVAVAAQPVEELLGERRMLAADRVEHGVAVARVADGAAR